MNRKTLAVLVVLAVSGAPASAAGFSVSLEQTLGSHSYRGTTGSGTADIGEHLYVSPSFQTFRNDASGGTYTNFGLRGGFEEGPFSLGAHGGFLPKTDGYGR